MTSAERKKQLAEIRFRWKAVDPEQIKICSPRKALEDVLVLLSEIDRRDKALRRVICDSTCEKRGYANGPCHNCATVREALWEE